MDEEFEEEQDDFFHPNLNSIDLKSYSFFFKGAVLYFVSPPLLYLFLIYTVIATINIACYSRTTVYCFTLLISSIFSLFLFHNWFVCLIFLTSFVILTLTRYAV